MAGLFGPETQTQPSADATIRKFSIARRSTIPEDDSNGSLLNEAVIAHCDNSDDADVESASSQDECIAAAILEKKMGELEVSRQKFLKHLDSQQKSNLQKAANTTEAILATIDSATFEWCKRRESGTGIVSALKRSFHRSCRALDQHAALFSMLPKEHEFVATFYGAFNCIVSASVMYQAMATELPRIVDELNAIVRDIAEKIRLFPDAKRQMKRVVVDLYIRIFELLAKLMEWYSEKRHTFKSFKKDCFNDVESELKSIRTWSDLIRSEVLTNMIHEMRQAREEDRRRFEQKMQKVSEMAESYFEAQHNTAMQQAVRREKAILSNPAIQYDELAELIASKISKNFGIVGTAQTAILSSMAAESTSAMSLCFVSGTSRDEVSVRGSHPSPIAYPVETIVEEVQNVHFEGSSPGTILSRFREEIERQSRFMDEWFPDGHVHPVELSCEYKGQLPLHNTVATRISHWFRNRDSQVFCVEFPYNPGQVSAGATLAYYVVSTALQAKHPMVSYFCSLPREGVPTGRSMQTVALCEMLASLIRQLVALLPESLPESAASLNQERFGSLDGTLRTWEPMLGIFADLLSLISQNLLIVLHGLQWLESETTNAPIQELINVIRRKVDSQETKGQGIVKALLVTEGQARAVVPLLQRGEHLLCEESRHLGGW